MKINGVGPDAELREVNGVRESKALAAFYLMPMQALYKIGILLKHGMQKYGKNNWRRIPHRSHINHAFIHLVAHIAGDTQDDHLTHAATRLMFAIETKDDRPYDKVGRKK